MKRDFKVTCLECFSDETNKNSDSRFHFVRGPVMPTKCYANTPISLYSRHVSIITSNI